MALPSQGKSYRTTGVPLMKSLFSAILLASLSCDLRARSVAIREQRRFCEVRDEAARTSPAQSRAPGFRSDHFAQSSDVAVSMENEHRTTIFWVGEAAAGNNPVPNVKSSWDANWTSNYGGFDNPDPGSRRNYIPVSFVPRQNPFYCALPYNDVTHGQIKPEAALVIPWFRKTFVAPGQSVCKSRWLAIRKGNRIAYAQWEDCGPFRTDHFQYVFQNERPKPNLNRGAGLDVSPAVRDYLGTSTDRCDRLAICRSARCSAGTLAKFWR